ncbi:MAG: hypothetical protein QMD03_02035 [Syntrophales bacterium]|nr:hypothetical protein [Syntrophales bacterium]
MTFLYLHHSKLSPNEGVVVTPHRHTISLDDYFSYLSHVPDPREEMDICRVVWGLGEKIPRLPD